MSALATSELDTLRRIHHGMIDAVLAGGGVEPVAAPAAERLGGTVAIALPAVEVSIGPPRFAAYVADRLGGRPVRVPPDVVAEVPNAAAGAVFAHRHTIASRLEQIRALTGHDPLSRRVRPSSRSGCRALEVQRAAARLE